MVFNFLRRKPRNYRHKLRDGDGHFSATGEQHPAVSNFSKDLKAVKTVMTQAAEISDAVTDSALKKLEYQERYHEMYDQGSPEEKGDLFDDLLGEFMSMMVQKGVSGQAPPGQAAQATPALSWGEPSELPTSAMTPQAVALEYPQEAQEPPQGVDHLNGILRKIAMIPDQLIRPGVVDAIAQQQGIDGDALKETIRKLSKVVD